MSKFSIASAHRPLGEVMNSMRFTAILAVFSILTACGQNRKYGPNCGKRLKRRWYEIGRFTTIVVFGSLALMVIVPTCSSG